MKYTLHDQFIRFPVLNSSTTYQPKCKTYYLPGPDGQQDGQQRCVSYTGNGSSTSKEGKLVYVLKTMNMLSFAAGVREHVRLAPKITETVKGKLSLGAKILQVGGVEKIFRQFFNVRQGDKLLKSSQCYLSTTSGPIAGLLFISTEKVAFCSERPIKFSTPTGKNLRFYYKVVIPVTKIKRINKSRNTTNPSQKYIEVATEDGFDFWFMGFFNYNKTFSSLQHSLLMRNLTDQ